MNRFIIAAIVLVLIAPLSRAQNSVGIFENHSDVGAVLHPGSTTFESANNTYTVRGSGENMWATADAFQFAWKKVSGDVEITADVQFANLTGNRVPEQLVNREIRLLEFSPDGALVYFWVGKSDEFVRPVT